MTQPYAALLDALLDDPDAVTFLRRVVRIAADDVLPGAACAGLMRTGAREWVTAASDQLAARADEIGYGADEGPCLDAIAGGSVVAVGNLGQDGRWPAFRPYAMVVGVSSLLAVPLRAEPRMAAALMVCSGQPDSFTGARRDSFEAFAARCAGGLAQLQRITDLVDIEVQLRQALDSRGIIDQAIGIVMAQQRCAADTALGLLRAASQRTNRKLRELSTDIVTRVGGQSPCPPTPFQIRSHVTSSPRPGRTPFR
ncbi:GAF and ANTAR domain-containing protein [Actinoplanes sp. N902-109]|uniref:GAF and ANTAR domain-containing protein n=1 Tax=Actinoplanes sp. (strain N902-109) TaxID=649831 RepID=UPI000329377D|nr:GAF and ANTAR domain-containing protein [Actinoplanes sp. N902-109]AGL17994.1 ANTAR domain-containing protein [Actinoplanes sp. N902-109]